MVEMSVAGIALDAASRSPIVLLRDPSGRRQVPIWIDQAQAQNIMAGLTGQIPPRPLSHDLMVSLLELGGLSLERVVIDTIEESTFRAVMKLSTAAGDTRELDARPSDAIALALRTGSGIWMLEEVVADASIAVDAEADAEDQADFRRFLAGTSPADLIRNLGRARQEVELESEAEPDLGPEGHQEAGAEEPAPGIASPVLSPKDPSPPPMPAPEASGGPAPRPADPGAAPLQWPGARPHAGRVSPPDAWASAGAGAVLGSAPARRPFGRGPAVSLFTLGTMRALSSGAQMGEVLAAALAAGIDHIERPRPMGPPNGSWARFWASWSRAIPAGRAGLVITEQNSAGPALDQAKDQLRASLERLPGPARVTWPSTV
jgi:bifunctional DNase/RNase